MIHIINTAHTVRINEGSASLRPYKVHCTYDGGNYGDKKD